MIDPNRERVESAPPIAPTERQNLWSVRDLLLFIVFTVVALIAANFLALGGYALLRSLVGWKTASQRLYDNTFFVVALQTIFHGLVFGYIFFLVVVNYRQRFWEALRWRALSGRAARNYFAGGVLLALAVVAFPSVLPHSETYPLQRLFSSPQAAYVIGAFAVFVAPFMEELIFRGVLFRFFEERVGLSFAVAGTAVLFAGLHVSEYWGAWNHVLLILLVGIVFSLARGLTGSIAPSFVLHLAYNATLMVMLFIETQRFQTLGAAFFG
jgi:membrane protease YdiL (CAAX protease family)